MKKCSKCHIYMDYSFFRKANTKDGFHCQCIECNRSYQNEWKIKNKDRVKEYMTEYHKEYYTKNKERIDVKNSEWCKENPDKMKIYSDKHRTKPGIQEKRNKKRSEWGKMNPGKNIDKCRKRKEMIKNTCDGTVTKQTLNYIIVNQGYKCNICSCDISSNYEKDHIIPLSKGGTHTIGNIQYLCGLCNRKKGTTIL